MFKSMNMTWLILFLILIIFLLKIVKTESRISLLVTADSKRINRGLLKMMWRRVILNKIKITLDILLTNNYHQ